MSENFNYIIRGLKRPPGGLRKQGKEVNLILIRYIAVFGSRGQVSSKKRRFMKKNSYCGQRECLHKYGELVFKALDLSI